MLTRSTIYSCTALIMLALIACAPTAHAQMYDVAADFSSVNNPAGQWSYGYQTSLAAPFTLYTAKGNFSNIDFWYLDGTGLPDVAKNNTAATQGFLPSGKLMFHPGNTPTLIDYVSVIRWTAPLTNTYQLSSLFTGIDPRTPNVQVSIIRNGTSDFNGIVSGIGMTQSYNHLYTFTAGSTLDFIVSNNGAVGDHNFTQLDATIVAVPEPRGLAMLTGTVFFGGSLLLRRRRK